MTERPPEMQWMLDELTTIRDRLAWIEEQLREILARLEHVECR